MAQDQDNFRDSIGTIKEDGKRAWVFPKKQDTDQEHH